MLWSVLLMSLAAEPLKLAAPGFTCEGVAPALCAASLERFSSLLGSDQVRVTTAKDVQAVLGLERQKQLLGCNDSSCLAELAGALGVDGMLEGSLVKTSTGWLVTLKVLRTRDGSTWLQASDRSRSDDAMETFLDETARRFRVELTPAPTPTPFVRWVPAIAGGAGVLVGAGFFISAKIDAEQLRDVQHVTLTTAKVTEIASRGQRNEAVGLAVASVGLAAIAASVLWVALGPSPVQAAVTFVPGGGAAVIVEASW